MGPPWREAGVSSRHDVAHRSCALGHLCRCPFILHVGHCTGFFKIVCASRLSQNFSQVDKDVSHTIGCKEELGVWQG